MKTETKELALEMYSAMNGAAIENPADFIERTVLKGINMSADGDMTENGEMVAHVEPRPDYRGKAQKPAVWDAADWELYEKFERELSKAQDTKSVLHVGYAEAAIEQVIDGVKRNRMKGELKKFVEHEGVTSWGTDAEPEMGCDPYPEPDFAPDPEPEPEPAPETRSIDLSGKTVAITGRLSGMDKAMAAKKLAAIGAEFANGVTKSINILVQADDTNTRGKSSKLKKAEKYGIEVIDEATFKAALAAPKEEPKEEPKEPKGDPKGEPKKPKGNEGGHNGLTWKERAEIGLKLVEESQGRLKHEWKGSDAKKAWLWLRAADDVEGTDPFTKAERKALKHKGGAGFRYKKYGAGSQYEEGTVMWYLPYPGTMKHRPGKGHEQYDTFSTADDETAA